MIHNFEKVLINLKNLADEKTQKKYWQNVSKRLTNE